MLLAAGGGVDAVSTVSYALLVMRVYTSFVRPSDRSNFLSSGRLRGHRPARRCAGA